MIFKGKIKYDGYANKQTALKKQKKVRLHVKDCQRYSAAPVHTPSCDVRLYIIIAGCGILISLRPSVKAAWNEAAM